MAAKRILSLWFPRLAAERVLRRRGDVVPPALAIVADQNGAQVICLVNDMAEAAGIVVGQSLRDATAICPGLHTTSADPMGEAMFLTVLRRWAGKFSPWRDVEAALDRRLPALCARLQVRGRGR